MFLQYRENPNWTYETSPAIDPTLLDNNFIRLCPDEVYMQRILDVDIDSQVIEEVSLTPAPPISIVYSNDTMINGANVLGVNTNGGDGMLLNIDPSFDFTGFTSVGFCTTFTTIGGVPANVQIRFVNNQNSTVFHTENYTYPGSTSQIVDIENIDIVGNEDFRIEIFMDLADGDIVNFFNFTFKSDNIQEIKAVDCNGNEVGFEYKLAVDNGVKFMEFKMLEETYCELIRLVIDNKFYSNAFVVTEEDKCNTSIIHYNVNSSLCNCEEDSVYFESVRLRLINYDCKDADEFDVSYEPSTGNTRASNVKDKTYKLWRLIGDKLVNNCFKEAYNSNKLYINRIRESKVIPFNRSPRLGNTNCSVTEFETDTLDDTYDVVEQIS